jgi:hypothetical protein
MSLSYRIIAPLIVPKLKKGIGCEILNSFLFSWNKVTGEQNIESNTEMGTQQNKGTVSISEILQEGIGQRLLTALDKTYKGWETMYGVIDNQNKKITLIFKDDNGTTLGIRTY